MITSYFLLHSISHEFEPRWINGPINQEIGIGVWNVDLKGLFNYTLFSQP